MSDKIKKIVIVLLGLLAILLPGSVAAVNQVVMFLQPARAAAVESVSFTNLLWGITATGTLATFLYMQFGHGFAVFLVSKISDWWKGSNLDPRAGDLLEFTLVEGLKKRRLTDSAFQAKVSDLADYCAKNPTAPPDLSAAAKAAKTLVASS
jgi:hypothetical protein